MKKYAIIFAAVLAAVTLLAAGCGEDNKPTQSETKSATASATTEASTAEETTKATKAAQKPTQATKATQKPTQETTEEVETQAQPADYKAILTSKKKWVCEKAVKNGKEINVQDYYGSVVKETGTYIQFKSDGTFKCVMGFEGCDGTYTVSDSGQLTVTKTVLYSATKEKKVNQTEKLTVEGNNDIESITMNLNGVSITFA